MSTARQAMIIGAGPAGLAAAVYLARAGVDLVILEAGEPGGLLRNAWLVENYPGFPEGITGPELASLMVRHAEGLGVKISRERVESLREEGGEFVARTEAQEHLAERVIIASGTVPVEPEGIAISPGAAGRVMRDITGVMGIEGKRFAIAGGGDAAFDYALSLAQHNRVAIFVRGAATRCLGLLRDRCEAHEGIEIYLETGISEIDAVRGGIVIVGSSGGIGISVEADYAVLALGRRPCLGFVSPETRRRFDLLSSSGRLYLAGDVSAGIFRQASIACGRGVEAAMMIAGNLEDECG